MVWVLPFFVCLCISSWVESGLSWVKELLVYGYSHFGPSVGLNFSQISCAISSWMWDESISDKWLWLILDLTLFIIYLQMSDFILHPTVEVSLIWVLWLILDLPLYIIYLEISLISFCIQQWKLHLFELEGEMKVEPPIKYVLYEVCI